MQVPQWAGRIPMGRRVICDLQLYLRGGAVIQILPRTGIPFLNWQVVVEDMFLELFYSSVSLHRVLVHH